MKVLILGGSGFIGRQLAGHLAQAGLQPLTAARRGAQLALDCCDGDALTAALRRCDAVVNAVAGSGHAIAEGGRVLARAVRRVGGLPVVHLSSMAVYGEREGRVAERDWQPAAKPVADDPPRGRYARAKREAEAYLAALAFEGTPVALLRPGCVWGTDSPLWFTRLVTLLAAGRLGDLGEAGDGWTQGLHVQDLCEAVLRLLGPARGLRVYNLAAPDSPRWNVYLRDLALATGATPLRRIPAWQLALDAWGASPLLYVAQRLGQGLRPRPGVAGGAVDRLSMPPPLPPGLLRLMRRQQRMDCAAATSDLRLAWTPYARVLEDAAAWRRASASRSARAMKSGLPST